MCYLWCRKARHWFVNVNNLHRMQTVRLTHTIKFRSIQIAGNFYRSIRDSQFISSPKFEVLRRIFFSLLNFPNFRDCSTGKAIESMKSNKNTVTVMKFEQEPLDKQAEFLKNERNQKAGEIQRATFVLQGLDPNDPQLRQEFQDQQVRLNQARDELESKKFDERLSELDEKKRKMEEALKSKFGGYFNSMSSNSLIFSINRNWSFHCTSKYLIGPGQHSGEWKRVGRW